MAVDMFIEFESIRGEFQGGKNAGQIQIQDFTFGGHANMSGGQRSGRTTYSDVTVFKFVDKSTPDIIGYMDLNKSIKSAKITVRKAGGKQQVFYTIELSEVSISSFNSIGHGFDGRGRPASIERKNEDEIQESFSMNFAKMTVTYAPQKADGQMSAETSYTIDLRNRP